MRPDTRHLGRAQRYWDWSVNHRWRAQVQRWSFVIVVAMLVVVGLAILLMSR